MSDPRPALGLAGEQAAARFLERRGLHIAVRRYRVRCGEIDLIARDGAVLVFVEVKTRKATSRFRPWISVTAGKRRRIGRAARWYLSRSGWTGACRFDVVEVLWEGDAATHIEHWVDAFRSV